MQSEHVTFMIQCYKQWSQCTYWYPWRIHVSAKIGQYQLMYWKIQVLEVQNPNTYWPTFKTLTDISITKIGNPLNTILCLFWGYRSTILLLISLPFRVAQNKGQIFMPQWRMLPSTKKLDINRQIDGKLQWTMWQHIIEQYLPAS